MKKMILILLINISLFAGNILSEDQIRIYNKVMNIAGKIKDKDGQSYASVMTAICLTESSFGRYLIGDLNNNQKDITKGSLGIMQVKVQTARLVGRNTKGLGYISKLSDLELAQKLISNHEFNIKVATGYFFYNKKRFKTLFRSISAYNGGLKNYKYVGLVLVNLNKIKNYRKQGII